MMACEGGEGGELINPFPTTPPQRSPPLSLTPLLGRNSNDVCFCCGKQGHWARDCPDKISKRSSSPASSLNESGLPVIRCPCGQGNCFISTSGTETNPGRKLYSCPGYRLQSGSCRFFKWCDDVVQGVAAPSCPCGAGMCSINRQSTDPNRGQWYFSCRIGKGHGACQFFQWADSHANNLLNKSKDDNKGYSSSQSLRASHRVINTVENGLSNKQDQSSEMEFEPSLIYCSEPVVISKKDEISSRSLFMREAVKLWHTMSRLENHSQQIGFRRKIADAAYNTSNGEVYQSLGLEVRSWLGRIAFPPSHPVKEHPREDSLSCVDSPSIDPAIAPEDVDTNAEMIDVEPSTLFSPCTSNAEPDDVLLLPLSPGQKAPRSGEVQNRGMSGLHWKTYGLGLLDILESMNPGDHEAMLEVATKTFDVLQWLSVDYGHFSKDVKRYIHFASGVASIESSIHKDPPSEELINRYNAKKAEFDAVSSCHAAAVNAKRDSDNHLLSLQEEESRLEDRLREVRKKISLCEEETLDRQARVYEMSKDMCESKRRMDAARKQMEEALEHEREREVMLDAARNALRQARLKLQE